MSFNSLEFALFLPVFFLIYVGVHTRIKVRDWVLLIGSYVFYMSWYWQYAGLIALSTMVDYTIGRFMGGGSSHRKRKALLCCSLLLNLGMLCLFKYYDFFAASTSDALQTLGFDIPIRHLELILPVGISFYTFQTLSYTIDRYREKIPAEYSLIKFATYVAFFPQLVAGPIVRASHLLPQLNRATKLSTEAMNAGLWLIFIGLFKKIVLADLLAFLIVDDVFANPAAFSSVDLMVGLYAYAFQIYCDFSGYSDIAIGIALLLGFRLPLNFNKPYLAVSPSDFWRRWHITLSEWLRDYLYIPLGGSKHGSVRTSLCLLVTMLLGGLWHGAAWNFVIWGGYHGALLVATRKFSPSKMASSLTYRYMAIFCTFHAVLFGWLLFRVSDMSQLLEYFVGVGSLTTGSQVSNLGYLVLFCAIVSHLLPMNTIQRMENCVPSTVRKLVVPMTQVGLLLLFVGVSVGGPSFIYFQF